MRAASRTTYQAKLIYTAIARIALLGDTPEAECKPVETARVPLLVYRARRGELDSGLAAWRVACTLAMLAGSVVDASRVGLSLEPPGRPEGLYALAEAVSRLERDPSPQSLRKAVGILARELASPCSPDPVLEERVAREESRLRAFGGLLGGLLALVFVAGLLSNPLVALASLVVLVAVWALIVNVGKRFHRLVVEAGWRKCSIDPQQLEEALVGPSLPSPMELLGIPPPRL